MQVSAKILVSVLWLVFGVVTLVAYPISEVVTPQDAVRTIVGFIALATGSIIGSRC